MTGEVLSYWERQKLWVQCKECGKRIALGSMSVIMKTQHERAEERIHSWAAKPPVKEPQTYLTAFLTAGVPRNCLVEGCPG